jgi:hypothetical protein
LAFRVCKNRLPRQDAQQPYDGYVFGHIGATASPPT